MKIKALLLDMDGTILNTEKIWNMSIKYANNHFGVSVPNDFYINNIGTTAQQKYEKLQPFLNCKNLSAEDYCNYQREWKKNHIKENGLSVRKGFEDLLSYAKTNGMKIALVTSSNKETIIFNFKYAKLNLSLFDCIVTGDEVLNTKPDAEPYKTAMKNLKIKNSCCVAVEDSNIGLCSALNAKVRAVFAKGTSILNNKLTDKICLQIDDFYQLLNWIKSENESN